MRNSVAKLLRGCSEVSLMCSNASGSDHWGNRSRAQGWVRCGMMFSLSVNVLRKHFYPGMGMLAVVGAVWRWAQALSRGAGVLSAVCLLQPQLSLDVGGTGWNSVMPRKNSREGILITPAACSKLATDLLWVSEMQLFALRAVQISVHFDVLQRRGGGPEHGGLLFAFPSWNVGTSGWFHRCLLWLIQLVSMGISIGSVLCACLVVGWGVVTPGRRLILSIQMQKLILCFYFQWDFSSCMPECYVTYKLPRGRGHFL